MCEDFNVFGSSSEVSKYGNNKSGMCTSIELGQV